MSKKELVKQESSVPAELLEQAQGGWGESNLKADTIIIPKILLMQGLSKLVAEGDAKMGEVRDSLHGRELGGPDKPLEVVPIKMEETWVVYNVVDGDKQFSHIEPLTAANAKAPFKENVGGVMIERDKTMMFYVLVADDVKEYGQAAMVHTLSFSRTSYRTGRVMNSVMEANMRMGKSPANHVINVSSVKRMKGTKPYFVFDVAKGREASADELVTAFGWFKQIQAGENMKHDDNKTDTKDEGFAPDNAPF